MKILYAIQATGNGHISRAREFLPILESGALVDLLVSGTESDLSLEREIRYRYKGFSYAYSGKGGIDYLGTLMDLKPVSFLEDISNCPVSEYDMVISDYEPVSAWACHYQSVPCVGLSHQSSFYSTSTPRPSERNWPAEWLFRNFAPCSEPIGFHYRRYDPFIHPPVVRQEIRRLNSKKAGHITVYLPAFDERYLIPLLKMLGDEEWHLFSKFAEKEYRDGRVTVQPVGVENYLESLESASAVLCGAGFEAPAEALYLGKDLLVVPMQGQYEQLCNAEALRRMGVPVAGAFGIPFDEGVQKWLKSRNKTVMPHLDVCDPEVLVHSLLTSAQKQFQVA